MRDLHDERAEAAVVGAALLMPAAARSILERGVRSDQIVTGRLRAVFAAVERVAQTADVDVTNVCSQLAADGHLDRLGGAAAIDALTAQAAAVGALPAHCDTVIDLARWRHRRNATHALQAAIEAGDPAAFETAENTLWSNEEQHTARTDWKPADAAAAFMRSFNGQPADVFPWPFDRLNAKSDGGAVRGEITVLAGPVTHGKSAFLDMCLESMHQPGLTVRIYLNEMKRDQRLARVAARRSGVELTRIQQAMRGLQPLDGPAMEMVRRSWAAYPVHITECSGWPIERVCRHARRHGADIIALDIINRLPFGKSDRSRTHQLDDAANQLDQLAKDCDMHVIVVAHLNRLRAQASGRPPVPALSDIKECAALVEIADNVVFVWRDPDPATGDPQELGMIRFGKNRTGELGGLEVRFQGEFQRFLEVDRRLEEVAA